MLFAIKGVLIKLIYCYGIETTSLLALRMAVAVQVFALVGALVHRLAIAVRDRRNGVNWDIPVTPNDLRQRRVSSEPDGSRSRVR